jgi:hypothetical protein
MFHPPRPEKLWPPSPVGSGAIPICSGFIFEV